MEALHCAPGGPSSTARAQRRHVLPPHTCIRTYAHGVRRVCFEGSHCKAQGSRRPSTQRITGLASSAKAAEISRDTAAKSTA